MLKPSKSAAWAARVRKLIALVTLAALLPALLTACADSLGSSCETDSECDDGQVCASPACISSDLVCLIPCGSDDECATNAGAGSTCTLDPLNVGCIGYCSAAD